MRLNIHPLNGAIAAVLLMAACEPADARFLSPDPVPANPNNGTNFNRYWYANNNPYKFTDPDGRYAERTWTSENSVTITIPFAISNPEKAKFATEQVQADVANKLSGTVEINGVDVKVTAIGVPVDLGLRGVDKSKVNIVTVVPGLKDSFTNGIGGNRNSIRPTAGSDVVTHELGHSASAGDQYPGGHDSSGKKIPGDYVQTQQNIMGDGRGGANSQTLREMVEAPSSKTCTASGDCR